MTDIFIIRHIHRYHPRGVADALDPRTGRDHYDDLPAIRGCRYASAESGFLTVNSGDGVNVLTSAYDPASVSLEFFPRILIECMRLRNDIRHQEGLGICSRIAKPVRTRHHMTAVKAAADVVGWGDAVETDGKRRVGLEIGPGNAFAEIDNSSSPSHPIRRAPAVIV